MAGGGNARRLAVGFGGVIDARDRAVGVLLGTALGDAFGAPFEGAITGAMERELSRRADRPRPWRYTDDTVTTLAVARALATGHEFEPERLLANLAGSFDPARGFGRGMRRCIEAYLGGAHWTACATTSWSQGSAGAGAAVRVSPISCRYWNDTAMLIDAAEQSSRVTHTHPDAITGTVVQALAIATCLQCDADSFSASDFVARIASHRIGGWSHAKIVRVRELLVAEAPSSVIAAELGNGVFAEQAVPAALWAFLRGAPSFERAIMSAASLGGDVDTICALTGALTGALVGRRNLPEHWLANLAHERPTVDEIEALGHSLLPCCS